MKFERNAFECTHDTRDISTVVKNADGKEIYRHEGAEVPREWSDLAATIAVSKYFHEHEKSVVGMITRVVSMIADAGYEEGYFDGERDVENFKAALFDLCWSQSGSFNSPVWFNCGLDCDELNHESDSGQYVYRDGEVFQPKNVYDYPQSSACFIQSVEDNMGSLMQLAVNEAMLFKFGSGTGTDLSTIRSSYEKLSGGGVASGPLSFLRVYDEVAGIIKSGGKCLAPWQKVYTGNGPERVDKLAESGENFSVLSYDPPAGRVKVKWARAWKSGHKKMVRVVTDKGSFAVSGDHPFLLAGTRDNVQAYKLEPGQRLFARSVSDTAHDYVRLTTDTKERTQLQRMVVEDLTGRDIRGLIVHHIDGNKRNNSLSNLKVMSPSEHSRAHGKELASKGVHVFQRRKFDHSGDDNGMHADGSFWGDKDKVEAYKEKQRRHMLESRDPAKLQYKAGSKKMLNTAWRLLNSGYDISTFERYIEARREELTTPMTPGSIEIITESIGHRFGDYSNFLSEVNAGNHKVIRVEDIEDSDVYSVEVDCPTEDDKTPDSGHNFMIWPENNDDCIGSGVFVANTRRSAKLNSLRVSHPDIMRFIKAKALEERKAGALVSQGYDGGFEGEAYDSVKFQNVNLSVGLTDEFMDAVEKDLEWKTEPVADEEAETPVYRAREIMKAIADAAHECGDPGVQFPDTMNRMNTVAEDGRYRTTNPCISGDSLVLMADGSEEVIEDLADGYDDVLIDIGDGTPAKAVNVRQTGVKPVYDLKTVSGISLRLTRDHKVFTRNRGFIAAGKLTGGDKIALSADDGELSPWTQLRELEYAGEEPVYDMEVPGAHRFVANGIIVHNCSEFAFLDDSACNLASINLMKFYDREKGVIEYGRIAEAVRIFITAQDILVSMSSYPTPEIAENSVKYRPLGLGFSNLGALLMFMGVPYDSREGRAIASSIASVMYFTAHSTSAEMAREIGPFDRYEDNKEHVKEVFETHRHYYDEMMEELEFEMSSHIPVEEVETLCEATSSDAPIRNAQFTLLAPTGTISLMMDCDTTGIEPELSLVKHKKLAGGGSIAICNKVAEAALRRLDYSKDDVGDFATAVENGEDYMQYIAPEDKPIFDCAYAEQGGRKLSIDAHLRMMSSVQRFLSGAISKTVNVDADATSEDIMRVYSRAHELGLKAVAVYREGSKSGQPLNAGKEGEKSALNDDSSPETKEVQYRKKLPNTRTAATHKFEISGHDGYVTVGLFPDGSPGELFITIAKEGSTVRGLLDCFATAVSIGLQFGAPLETFIRKFKHTVFEPNGFVNNGNDIHMCNSIPDYVFRWLETGEYKKIGPGPDTNEEEDDKPKSVEQTADTPPCPECGMLTARNGTCFKCLNCGHSLGCS